jgi:hypothetical protein
MDNVPGKRDIITEISGVDSGRRISAKPAAAEILLEGQPLFDIVLETALNSKGYLAERCAEACARASVKNGGMAGKRKGKIIRAVLKNPDGRIRYFLAVMLLSVKTGEKDGFKCARIINEWLKGEESRGAKACFLEAIAKLAAGSKKARPMAERLMDEALKSPVASYSARARQIIKRKEGVSAV